MVWIVVLLLIGALLLAAETMVPGGVLGFVGGAFILVGVVTAYRELPFSQANWVLAAVSAALVLGTVAWLVWFPTSRLARHLSAHQTVGNLQHDYGHLVDRSGVARTALRPSGIAELDGARRDVITEGEYVEAGAQVVVISVAGSKIVVRATERGSDTLC